jgi:DNA-binding NtrC family response regulator
MDKIKLLLVDDEEDFVKALSERIKMRKIGSDIALDGETALEMVNDQVPDVMVLDIKMPGIDGIEVLRRIKKQYPKIQVIILTGHGTQKEVDQVKKLGAFEVHKKPVDIDVLVDGIKRAYKSVDRMMTAITFAEAGEVDTARKYLEDENNEKG